MPETFVFINSEIGQEDQVIIDLQAIPEIKESYAIYGLYDVIVKVEADSMQRLKDVVSHRIRQQDTVRATLTLVVV